MKQLLFIILVFCLGACSKSLDKKLKYINYPSQIHSLKMDSIDSGILLNASGIATTEDYLIISNLNKDTIFDIFDIDSLRYLYSDLIYGQGGNDMLPFRWMRTFDNNEFYTIGFGIPTITILKVENGLKISKRKNIEWEEDICQNLYLLKDGKILIQPGKKQGEWSLYDTNNGEAADMPEFPFKKYEPDYDIIKTFQNRAVYVAVNIKEECIAFFYYKIPFMQLFDFNGNVLSEGFIGNSSIEPLKYFYNDTMYYTGCSYTDEFVFVKFIPNNAEDGTTYFQVWDWDGNMLSLFKINSVINLFTVSRDSKTMYVVKSDNDNIFRCDLSSIIAKL